MSFLHLNGAGGWGGGGGGGGGREVIHEITHLAVTRVLISPRNALMAVWSKTPQLIASWFSPLPGLESWPGHVRKLPVTWG